MLIFSLLICLSDVGLIDDRLCGDNIGSMKDLGLQEILHMQALTQRQLLTMTNSLQFVEDVWVL